MKRVILFGSTGSIGRNAIEVIRSLPDYRIVGLASFSNHQRLMQQAKTTKASAVAIISKKECQKVNRYARATRVFCGEEGLVEMVDKLSADILVAALSSSTGIYAILRAIEKRMRVCLATKEILVSYGEIVMKAVRKNGVQLIPIDSEHSAVYQCLEGRRPADIAGILLTASGGPFLRKSVRGVRKADVLNHPVWDMGEKITVDSATMMNKGLEIIEAHHLFGIPADKIKVVIHPEAICHSLVQFNDGSMLGQLSVPDMRLPIQYALTAPKRFSSPVKPLRLDMIPALSFLPPDFKKFPCLGLAYKALAAGKSMPAVLNAANEQAVRLFLADRLRYHEIPGIIERVMRLHKPRSGGIEDYRWCEQWAREKVKEEAS